jgi:hypothetical protein
MTASAAATAKVLNFIEVSRLLAAAPRAAVYDATA